MVSLKITQVFLKTQIPFPTPIFEKNIFTNAFLRSYLRAFHLSKLVFAKFYSHHVKFSTDLETLHSTKLSGRARGTTESSRLEETSKITELNL